MDEQGDSHHFLHWCDVWCPFVWVSQWPVRVEMWIYKCSFITNVCWKSPSSRTSICARVEKNAKVAGLCTAAGCSPCDSTPCLVLWSVKLVFYAENTLMTKMLKGIIALLPIMWSCDRFALQPATDHVTHLSCPSNAEESFQGRHCPAWTFVITLPPSTGSRWATLLPRGWWTLLTQPIKAQPGPEAWRRPLKGAEGPCPRTGTNISLPPKILQLGCCSYHTCPQEKHSSQVSL